MIVEPHLANRELDVLACLIEIRETKIIAKILEIQPKVIDNYIEKIKEKFHVSDRGTLAEKAKKLTFVDELKRRFMHLSRKHEFSEFLSSLKNEFKHKKIVFKIECYDKMLKMRIEQDLERSSIRVIQRSKGDIPAFSMNNSEDYELDFLKTLNSLVPIDNFDKRIEPLQQNTLQIDLLPERSDANDSPKIPNENPNEATSEKNFPPSDVPSSASEPLAGQSLSAKTEIPIARPTKEPPQNQHRLIKTTILSTIGTIFILSCWLWFSSQPNETIRSDSPLPLVSQTLNRSKIIKRIDALFSNLQSTNIVVLMGIGGAGKTTLARQYARQTKASVIWEINAETKESTLSSFANLCYFLSKTQEEKQELEHTQKIENQVEYAKKLTYLTQQKLKHVKNWFLIFDNVEILKDIQAFLPIDPLIWGKGKILMTTRNQNIVSQGLVEHSHIIAVDELTAKEKFDLFQRIQGKDTQKPDKPLSDFLEKIPPFPLDVSVAAYFIKNTKNSYGTYLERLQQRQLPEKDLDTILPPGDLSNYQKTRYQIIACTIDQILSKHNAFASLLFLVCMVDSQNISKYLLTQLCAPLVVDSFIREMAQASLLTYHANTNTNTATLFMHRSIQQNIWEYLCHKIPQQQKQQYIDSVIEMFEKHCATLLEKTDSEQMRAMIRHLNACLSKSNHQHNNLNRYTLQSLLGSMYCELGNPTSAKNFLEPTLDGFEAYYKNTNHIRLARTLAYLGITERSLGNYQKAKLLLEKSINMYHQLPLYNKLEQAIILSHLSCIYRFTNEIEKAKKTIVNSINLYNQHGRNTLGFSLALSDLASIYFNMGDYPKAINYHLQSLLIIKKLYGQNHFKTLLITGLLGMDYRRVGNYKKSLDAFKISYEGLKKHHADNLEIIIFTTKFGEMYRIYGQYEQAKKFLVEGFELSKKYYGTAHIHTYWAAIPLSQMYIDIGDYKKAQTLLEESFREYCRHFGADHEKTINMFQQLAVLYTHLGLYQKAKTYFEKSLQAYAKRYGKNHVDYALVLKDFGWFNVINSNFDIAEQQLKEALLILQKECHPESYRCFEYLGDLNNKKTHIIPMTDPSKLKQLKKQALFFYNKSLTIIQTQFPQNSAHSTRIRNKINSLCLIV